MGVRLSDINPRYAAQLGLAAGEPAKRGNKFNAQRTECGFGHKHDSKAEARRCGDLNMLLKAGAIRNLDQQPRFFFTTDDGRQVRDERGRAISYRPDFSYEEATKAGGWARVCEDVKSKPTRTEAAALRMTFFRHFHPDIDLREVS